MKRHKNRLGKSWRSFSLMSLLVFMTIVALFFIWRQDRLEKQIIDRWIDIVLAEADPNRPRGFVISRKLNSIECPEELPDATQIRFLLKSINRQPTVKRRNCVLKIIAEQFPGQAHDLFVKIATTTNHVKAKRNAILLAALYRVESDVDKFTPFIEHKDPLIRSAAIDAIGIIYFPSFEIPNSELSDWVYFRSDPEINLKPIKEHLSKTNRGWAAKFQWDSVSNQPIPPTVRQQILERMISDNDEHVRSAAARAIKQHPPDDYQLRIAEWGVWIEDKGDLVLLQSVFDEIPEFVHRTNDSVRDIADLRQVIFPTTKPILHFYANQPLSVDLSVQIFLGRPWFVFPAPDDYSIKGYLWDDEDATFPPDYKPMEPAKIAKCEFQDKVDLREGYPWLTPKHQTKQIDHITQIGFRWQSLIVLPQKTDWMTLEPITEAKYSWWNRLREVPSAWVSNRGESDRFLYYDGPTECASPISAQLERTEIKVKVPEYFPLDAAQSRHVFFIEVSDDHIAATEREVTFDDDVQLRTQFSLPIDRLTLQGDAVKQRLTQILVDHGLQLAEAKGLVDCWTPQFFEAKGQRLLTVFGKEEYDVLCPLEISPTPTELIRVGIVLTEFSGVGAHRPKKKPTSNR